METPCWRALREQALPATPDAQLLYRGELERPHPTRRCPAWSAPSPSGPAAPGGSYPSALLDDGALIGEKVMEDAEEVARAAREESDERVDEEAADVLYHLLVLLRSRGRELADAERVLDARRR
jgi:phosphoribosyl-ATP pyrophosphohydrolase/phosphoribosyl-AMP cyclohydrolase